MLRTGRKGLAAATLVLDALKATAAVLLGAWLFGPAAALAAAAGAVLGHLYPVWLKFRGGKGVATFLGGLIGMAWPAALAFAVVWLAVAFVDPLFVGGRAGGDRRCADRGLCDRASRGRYVFALLAALVWFKHSANIRRLLAGTELKIGRLEPWRRNRLRRASPTSNCSTGCG